MTQKAVCSFLKKLFCAVCWLTVCILLEFLPCVWLAVNVFVQILRPALSLGADWLPKSSVAFNFCLWIMVFIDNPFQREVVKNLLSTSRALWASWKRETQCNYKGALRWNYSEHCSGSHIILSLHLGTESLAGWWKMSFWVAYSRLSLCVCYCAKGSAFGYGLLMP